MTIAVLTEESAVLGRSRWYNTAVSAHDVDGLNSGYARLLLEDYLENPDAVPAEWRELFESGDSALVASHPGLLACSRRSTAATAIRGATRAAAAAPRLPSRPRARRRRRPRSRARSTRRSSAASPPRWRSSRRTGCTGTSPRGSTRSARSRSATPRSTRRGSIPPLTPELQARIPAKLLRLHVPGETLREALPAPARGLLRHDRLRDRAHLRPRRARLAPAGDRVRAATGSRSTAEERRAAARSRLAGRGLRAVPPPRRSSARSSSRSRVSTSLVPMLDEAIELAAAAGAHEVVIGMAHRGRLNVLVHTVGRSYESILREFEGERTIDAVVVDRRGRHRRRQVPPRRDRHPRDRRRARSTVTLAPNPSHLEAVDPVVEGWTRAEQTDRSFGAGIHDPSVALPVLIHGDASFAGPGRRRRDAQPVEPRRLLDRRHAAPDRQQPGRLHDRPGRGPLDALLERPRQGLRHPDRPRQRRRSRGGGLARSGSRSPTGRSSATTSSSTSSATGASATTSRTRPRTRSR